MAAQEELLNEPKIEAEELVDSAGSENEDGKDGSGSGSSRGEKKARKMLAKLGLKPVKGFTKCELRSSKQRFPICVRDPTVFILQGKTPTYVIVGPIRFDDYREELQRHAQALRENELKRQQATGTGQAQTSATVTEVEPEADMTGLNESDVNLAMQQTGKSKAEVVQALQMTNGDLIEAIMQLTS